MLSGPPSGRFLELHSYATIPTCPGHPLTLSSDHRAVLICSLFSSAECEILNGRVRTGATCADSGGAVRSDASEGFRRGQGEERREEREGGGCSANLQGFRERKK